MAQKIWRPQWVPPLVFKHLTVRPLAVVLATLLAITGVNGAWGALVVDYSSSASAGDIPAVGGDSFSIDDSGPIPVEDSSSVTVIDGEPTVVGRADANGGAEITADRLRFAQQVAGRGVHSVTSTSVLTADITNNTGQAGLGSLGALVEAGGVGLLGANIDDFLDDEIGLTASMEVAISVDGDPLLGFTTSVSWDGTQSFEGPEFEALLNPASFLLGYANFIGWAATEIDLGLGYFDIGQTKNVVYSVTTTTSSTTTNCQEVQDCALAFASFGDPPPVEDYSYMLFSMIIAPVPEPAPLALLGLGCALLLVRRRR